MRFVRVRVPDWGWAASEVAKQLGAEHRYHLQFPADEPGSAVVEFVFPSEEEAVRAAALAALLGYDVSNELGPP